MMIITLSTSATEAEWIVCREIASFPTFVVENVNLIDGCSRIDMRYAMSGTNVFSKVYGSRDKVLVQEYAHAAKSSIILKNIGKITGSQSWQGRLMNTKGHTLRGNSVVKYPTTMVPKAPPLTLRKAARQTQTIKKFLKRDDAA